MTGRTPEPAQTPATPFATGAADGEGDYPRPFVSVDVVILTLRHGQLFVLLIRRGAEPFRGAWALPGGYIHPGEDADLDAAARRILQEKAGIESPYVEQLQGFGNGRRDPRGWSATFAYFALIESDDLILKKGADAEEVAWWELSDDDVGIELAFDHTEIVAAAVTRLRNKVEYTSLPVHLLPAKFTLPDLQRVYEQILGRRIDKSAFRKRIAEADFLEPVPGEKRPASHRPAQIYQIKRGLTTIFFDRTI
jgi:ADP-ribose pyrophosphatase YjhB (NUDIX family)